MRTTGDIKSGDRDLISEIDEIKIKLLKSGRQSATLVIGFTDDCDYNITGLGTTDNAQTTINEAIAALPDTGGKIILREGTYDITDTITINKNNITFEGMGNATIIKRASAFTGGIVSVSAEYCKIKDCVIDGNKTAFTGTCHGIVIERQHNTIAGNIICRATVGGILLSGGSYNVITNNICSKNSTGILLGATGGRIVAGTNRNNSIIGNYCEENSNYGILLRYEATPPYHYIFSDDNNISVNTIVQMSGIACIKIEGNRNLVTGNKMSPLGIINEGTGTVLSGNSPN